MATVPNTVKRRGSLRDLRTAVTARIRSKPTIEGQQYLDLYVLQRDRFRWMRLMQQAERSIQSIDLALRQMGFCPESGAREQPAPAAHSARPAAGKTIDLRMPLKRKRSA